MDETGHSGDTGAAESGAGADSRDRTLLNGWSRSEHPWSNAGSALDPAEDDDIPAWRRPSTEIRPFTRQPLPPEHPSGEVRPFGDRYSSPEVRPFGSSFSAPEAPESRFTSGDVRPTDNRDAAAPRWADNRSRYSDLMSSPSANGTEPTGLSAPVNRPDSLENDDRPLGLRSPLDAPPPSSAPPYPYEGDLDDAHRDPPPAPPSERPTRPVFPAVRPATPGGRRTDWIGPEPVRPDLARPDLARPDLARPDLARPDLARPEQARHALEPHTPPDGMPRLDPVGERAPSADPPHARASYDPVSFPRRLRYEPAQPAGSVPPADPSPGYAAPTPYTGYTGRSAGDPGATPVGDQIARALPQRVPAEPDVPTVPEPPSVEPPAETPALARIATHLRRDDVLSASQERQEGFDVQAILAAVREVEGVRDASLRSTPAGAHSLRLDLAEGADPAEVSRHVARLLQDRMGLDAAMQGDTPAPPLPAAPTSVPPSAPFVPAQAGPGRAPTGTAAVPGEDLRRMPTAPQPAPRPAEPEVRSAPALDEPPAPPAPVPGGPLGGGSPSPEAAEAGCTPRPLDPGDEPGPRVVIDNVQVNTFGSEATVEVRLTAGGRTESGVATGPAFDGYLLRLCAMAAASALDALLASSPRADGPVRCVVEHAAAVPFGPLQVAVVVVLLTCDGWTDQLSGSAVVAGEDRQAAMVRATLAAVNRRLEALLS